MSEGAGTSTRPGPFLALRQRLQRGSRVDRVARGGSECSSALIHVVGFRRALGMTHDRRARRIT